MEPEDFCGLQGGPNLALTEETTVPRPVRRTKMASYNQKAHPSKQRRGITVTWLSAARRASVDRGSDALVAPRRTGAMKVAGFNPWLA
jgi:hypothetical protein